jgi:hypothetical protein
MNKDMSNVIVVVTIAILFYVFVLKKDLPFLSINKSKKDKEDIKENFNSVKSKKTEPKCVGNSCPIGFGLGTNSASDKKKKSVSFADETDKFFKDEIQKINNDISKLSVQEIEDISATDPDIITDDEINKILNNTYKIDECTAIPQQPQHISQPEQQKMPYSTGDPLISPHPQLPNRPLSEIEEYKENNGIYPFDPTSNMCKSV